MALVENIRKPINLYVLDQELGGHGLLGPSLADLLSDGDCYVQTVPGSPVTQKQLEAAVAAHVAPPSPLSDAKSS